MEVSKEAAFWKQQAGYIMLDDLRRSCSYTSRVRVPSVEVQGSKNAAYYGQLFLIFAMEIVRNKRYERRTYPKRAG